MILCTGVSWHTRYWASFLQMKSNSIYLHDSKYLLPRMKLCSCRREVAIGALQVWVIGRDHALWLVFEHSVLVQTALGKTYLKTSFKCHFIWFWTLDTYWDTIKNESDRQRASWEQCAHWEWCLESGAVETQLQWICLSLSLSEVRCPHYIPQTNLAILGLPVWQPRHEL